MSINLLNDDTAQYVREVDYTRTWSVAHHIRFLIFAHTILQKNCKHVVDIGFGQNLLVEYLNKTQYNGNYVGLDLNEEYVRQANEQLQVGCFADYPFSISYHNSSLKDFVSVSSHAIDCIVLGEVIEHIPKETAAEFLSYCKSRLHDNGIIILSTPNKINGKINWPDDHEDEFSYNELQQVILDAGLNIERDFGYWNNTQGTKEMLSTADVNLYNSFENYIPQSLLNVMFNITNPSKSRALIFILTK